MRELTEEHKKEFLEWCGFTVRCTPEQDAYKRGLWNYPDGMRGEVELDLNFLFKWAVPKLWRLHHTLTIIALGNYCVAEIQVYIGHSVHYDQVRIIDKNPALALFWAIWEVIKNE